MEEVKKVSTEGVAILFQEAWGLREGGREGGGEGGRE